MHYFIYLCFTDVRFYFRFIFLNRYANELRYALIHAVFVTPIQLQIYHMPHTLRIPRQIKVADPKEWFDIQLRKRLEKAAYESTIPGK